MVIGSCHTTNWVANENPEDLTGNQDGMPGLPQRHRGILCPDNSGLTGTWWDSARSGEGFLMDFGFAGGGQFLFGSFYTYDSDGNQAWLTFQSTSMEGTTVNVNVFITDGAMWGDDFNSADVNNTAWGTGSFTFPTCTAGSVSLTPNQAMQDAGFTDLAYALSRDLIESGIQCPTFVNNAP